MQAAAIGLPILGSAASTFGQVQARDVNAKVLSEEAKSTEQAAAYDEGQYRRQAHLALGEANAQGAASGTQAGSGSSMFLELDRVKQAETEALNIRRTGALKAQGLRFASKLERRKIPFDIIGGVAGAGSSAVSGFSQSSILSTLAK